MITMAADGIELFLPKTYDMFWSLVVLIILGVFFFIFFMPRFKKIFDERASRIEGNIAKAEQANKDAQAAKENMKAS